MARFRGDYPRNAALHGRDDDEGSPTTKASIRPLADNTALLGWRMWATLCSRATRGSCCADARGAEARSETAQQAKLLRVRFMMIGMTDAAWRVRGALAYPGTPLRAQSA